MISISLTSWKHVEADRGKTKQNKTEPGVIKIAQQVEVLASKSDDLSLIPRTIWWEEKTNSGKAVL